MTKTSTFDIDVPAIRKLSTDIDLHAISLRGFLSTLAGTILFHAVIYFYNHRIPDELPDGTSAPENLASAMRTSIPAVAPVTTEPKQNP